MRKIPIFIALCLTIVFLLICVFAPRNNTEVHTAVVSPALASKLALEQKEYYHYNLLEDNDKLLYVDILYVLTERLNSYRFTNLSESNLQIIIDFVLADHPEIFYFSNYNYIQYDNGDLEIQPIYDYTPEVIDSINKTIDDYVNDCLDDLDTDDDYETVKYFYEYLIDNTFYDTELYNNQFIDSVVCEHRSVCNGYAKMFQYLCYEVDIPCIFVKGIIRDTAVSHAWNIVKINDNYYHVDCTWGDTSQVSKEFCYDFLLLSDEDIKITHIISNKAPMPDCNTLSDNYYVKEQLYFDAFNFARYNKLLSTSCDYLTIRCKDKNILDEFTNYLFEEENIFNSLNTEDIYYRINESNNTFTVYFNT